MDYRITSLQNVSIKEAMITLTKKGFSLTETVKNIYVFEKSMTNNTLIIEVTKYNYSDNVADAVSYLYRP